MEKNSQGSDTHTANEGEVALTQVQTIPEFKRIYLLGGVSLSWLGCLDWEEDQLGLVLLEALHVQLKGLNAAVTATHVNADANGLGLKSRQKPVNSFKLEKVQNLRMYQEMCKGLRLTVAIEKDQAGGTITVML